MKPAAHLAWVLLVLLLLPACSDKSRRLNEREAIQYKQALLREHPGEISPLKLNEFMMTPGRTRGDIDKAFDSYRAEYSAQQALERREFEADRKDEADEVKEEEKKSEKGESP
jgi:hypothetical protein